MKSYSSSRMAGLAVALALNLVFAGAAPAETFTCTTVCNFGPGNLLDNVTVKDGGVATFDGTRVVGNIVVENGGALYLINGVNVEGSVQSFGGSEISILNAVIGGSIQIKNTPLILVEQSSMTGDLQLEENDATSADTSITSNTIGGNLQLYKNRFTGRVANVRLNEVYGNLQLVNNQGGSIIIEGNYIESALQCNDGDSRISGGGNDVGDLECSSLNQGGPVTGNLSETEVLNGSDDDTIGSLSDSCGVGVAPAGFSIAAGLATMAGWGMRSHRRRREA